MQTKDFHFVDRFRRDDLCRELKTKSHTVPFHRIEFSDADIFMHLN